MNDSNTQPVAVPDTTSVTEDEVLVANGNVLANDSDPNGLTLSVVAVNGIAIDGTTTIIGTYGTLVIQPDGQYSYTLSDQQADVRALANLQAATDSFSYTVSDGQTYTQATTQTVRNLIPYSEDFTDPSWVAFGSGASPVVTPSGDAGPQGGGSVDRVTLGSPDSGLYFQTNVGGTYTFSVWVRLVSGDGDFALNYYAGSSNTAVTQDMLATGSWQRVSLTFTADGNATSNVAIMHDLGQSAGGTFEFWGAQLNAGATALPYVPTSGEPVTATVTTTTPVVIGSTLTVDVTGNTPVANPDTATVDVGGPTVATGNVLANDTDGAGKTLGVATVDGIAVAGPTTIVGTYGTLVIQPDGQYSYTLAGAAAVAAGSEVQDNFSYTVSDGQTYTQATSQTVQNLIPYSEDFTSSSWVKFGAGQNPVVTANVAAGPNGGASTADAVTLSSASSGLYYQTGVSGTYTFSVWVRLLSGDGDFALNYYSGATQLPKTETLLATGSWQQVSLTFTGDGNPYSNVALMHTATQTAGGTFEFWGAQLNPGASPEPYVPTSGSPVTSVITTTTPSVIGSTLTVDVACPVCFAAGTRLATRDGEMAVEALRVGDAMLTRGGAVRPVRWIGRRVLDVAHHSVPERVQPVRILADAFAAGVPRHDVWLSPEHAVFVEGVLIPVRLLVNGASIRRDVGCRAVTYYHVELDAHDVLLAEGLPVESYLDTGNRGFFDGGGAPSLLYPDVVGQVRREQESCAPFVADAAMVESAWRRLARRAVMQGHRLPDAPDTTDNPDLRVMLGGRCLRPVAAEDGRHIFALPATGEAVWLLSHAAVASETQPWIEDRRRLGVMVSRLTLLNGDAAESIPLDHPALGEGWWDVEWHSGHALRRWTNGQARLPIRIERPVLLEVELARTLAYPVISSR